VEPTGHEALIYLNTGNTELVCKTNDYDHSVLKKDNLIVYFNMEKVLFFDAESGERILEYLCIKINLSILNLLKN
jgi:hypothetical protein